MLLLFFFPLFRKELAVFSQQRKNIEDEEVESLLLTGPSLLITGSEDTGSLMQEIAAKEGIASPLIREELVLQPNPFLRSSRSGSMRKSRSPMKRPIQKQLSLPDLTDISNLEELAAMQPYPDSDRLLPNQL